MHSSLTSRRPSSKTPRTHSLGSTLLWNRWSATTAPRKRATLKHTPPSSSSTYTTRYHSCSTGVFHSGRHPTHPNHRHTSCTAVRSYTLRRIHTPLLRLYSGILNASTR
jgi:hypothetical protein